MDQAFNITTAFISNFSLAEAQNVLIPLIIYVLGIVLYTIFIFKFYRFIARKEIFKFETEEYDGAWGKGKKALKNTSYFFKHLVLFPTLSFLWFLVLTIFLSFIAKEQAIPTIMLLSMSLVASIRITAYYNEDLSKDIAKMIPFVILGVFIVEMQYFHINESIAKLMSIPVFWKTIIYYLGLVAVLEWILRAGYLLKLKYKKEDEFKELKKKRNEE